jgi:D-alanyl-D-alanine carboxypeptidase
MLPIALAMSLVAPDPSSPSLQAFRCQRAPATAEAQSPSALAVASLAEDWFRATNMASDAEYIRFIKERGPILRDGAEQWLELRNNLRGVQFCGFKSADQEHVDLWIFDPEYDSFGVARFKLGKALGDKVEFVFTRLSDDHPSGTPQPTRLTQSMLVKAVEQRAAVRAAKDQFSGAILLAQHGRLLFQMAYGLADRAAGIPNRLDTQFRFGSMGKMFTVVGVMQLVEAGSVDLAAPIGTYLTDYPNRNIATKVTVAQLLSHTGGTGDIFGPDFEKNKGSLHNLSDYVSLYGSRAPDFSPGSRSSYSNYGFILLGRIIERVSGLSYDEYIQRSILGPTGMTSTGNQPESIVLPRRAVSYMGSGARLKRADETLPLGGTSAGGGYSTVGDFQRFVTGLTSNRLMRRETFAKLVEGGVKTEDGQLARFDFGGSMPGAGRYIGHGGGAPGMSGLLLHSLDNGCTVIVLANRDPGTAESIALFAAHRLPVR